MPYNLNPIYPQIQFDLSYQSSSYPIVTVHT